MSAEPLPPTLGHVSQGRLLFDALELVAAGASTQEAVAAELERRYPQMLHSPACYLNPAAEAVMRAVRKELLTAQGIEADRARLRAAGKPESWADRKR